MEKKALKIFLSCAIGAGLGTMLSLNLKNYVWDLGPIVIRDFWLLGPIVGGLFGYLSYEFKEVIAAVKTTWFKLVDYNWLEGIKTFAMKTMTFSLIVSALTFSILILYLVYYSGFLPVPGKAFSESHNLLFGLTYLFLLICSIFLSFFMPFVENVDWQKERNLKKAFLFLNPVAVFTYWPIKSLIEFIKLLISITPGIIKEVWEEICVCGIFIKTVVVLIHSKYRLLCGVDAAIGAVIGYFSGYVFVGLIAGGVLGVVNYELVSKRWLKLVPAPNK